MHTYKFPQLAKESLATSKVSAAYALANVVLRLCCLVGSCLNCSTDHGKCVKGFCVCDLGWEGRSCELKG